MTPPFPLYPINSTTILFFSGPPLRILNHAPYPPFRSLRPLRVATHMDGIRAVVASMAQAIPAISEIFLVASLLYYIFAVLGVNLMSGLFMGCYSGGSLMDPYYLVAADESINRTW